ncbi:hypothetical protein [Metabacillus malikii]|uniref:Peptide zinc metalloprotease protein n=1 Tax=Metabacillus malikii TaxID=1504265 RepID=A0ABT9ZDR2_9BACI|nr:hypothetical protein [Metabacillus malikii]MDQ0230372.1 hypothetical protein [Metabacillus malikii]
MENKDRLLFIIGKIKEDRYWIQRPDQHFFQIDSHTKDVLEYLANSKSDLAVLDKFELDDEDICQLYEMLGIRHEDSFSLINEDIQKTIDSYQTPSSSQHKFINRWIHKKWFITLLLAALICSIASFFVYIKDSPVYLVTSVRDQWIIVAALMISVILHELGHLFTMPRSKNISVSVQWSGPIPLFSIICNEAWKLSKYERIRINLAGFVTDILVCGLVCLIGLLFRDLSPWIWSFLIVHVFRMIFAICPFLPGDGYWVLVDLFNQPNLWKQSISQLKQLKVNWHSLYALSRILFTILIWGLFTYMMISWGNVIGMMPFHEAMLLFLRPAPLFLTLNAIYLAYSVIHAGIGKWQANRQVERAV